MVQWTVDVEVGSKGILGRGYGSYRGTEARGTRKRLDTELKRESHIQKGLVSHGPKLGLSQKMMGKE